MLLSALWLLSFLMAALASSPNPADDSPKNSEYVLVPKNGLFSRTPSPGSPLPIKQPLNDNPSSFGELSPRTALAKYLKMHVKYSDETQDEEEQEEKISLQDLALVSDNVQKDAGINFEESIAIIQEMVEDLIDETIAGFAEIQNVANTESNWSQPTASIAVGALAVLVALAFLSK